jgi:hypothetical protein
LPPYPKRGEKKLQSWDQDLSEEELKETEPVVALITVLQAE